MKKFILIIIGAFYLFAIQLADAECHQNVWYNGQMVTYCEGNNANDSYYYSNLASPSYYPYQYQSYGNYSYYNPNYSSCYDYATNRSCSTGEAYYYSQSYSYSNDYDYCDYHYCNLGNRTKEENYYNLLYMNDIGGPSTKTATPDYFRNNIIAKDKELDMIDAIKMKRFTFRYASNTAKYADAVSYVDALKQKIKEYYNQDKISYNKIYAVINDLDYLVYNLNGQFTNTKIYDTTGNKEYKEVASEYATQVKTSYDRLKFSLQTYR